MYGWWVDAGTCPCDEPGRELVFAAVVLLLLAAGAVAYEFPGRCL